MKRKGAISRLLCASALVATLAAPAAADVVVFEAHGGSRPSDAAALLAPVYEELRALGYAADPAALATRIEARLNAQPNQLCGGTGHA